MLTLKALNNNPTCVGNTKQDFNPVFQGYNSGSRCEKTSLLTFTGDKLDVKEEPKKKKFNIPFITGLISASSQLFGGLCLVISSLLPGNNVDAKATGPLLSLEELADKDVLSYRAMPPELKMEQFAVDPTELQAKDTMNTVKDVLNKMGWVSLSVGSVTSGVGIAGMGMKSNQPSILLGGLGVLGCSPLMVIDPSIAMRGALNIALATFFSGFSNKIRNENELKPGEKPREFDLSFLKDKKLWSAAFRDKVKTGELSDKLLDTAKFIVQDQVLLLTTAKKAVDQSVKKLFGIRKELPDFMTLKPSSDQRQISSMLVFAGGIPLLVFGGSVESLTPIANALTGTGFATGNLGMFALGRKQTDSTRPALLIGVPLKLIGDFLQTTDWGFGLSRMGSSSHNYYIAMQNKDKKPKNEPVKDQEPEKAIIPEKPKILKPDESNRKPHSNHKENVKLQKGLKYSDSVRNKG